MEPINYPRLKMDEIPAEARKIAVAWIENYRPYSSVAPEIAQKVKLASDIVNYSEAYLNSYKASLKEAIEKEIQNKEKYHKGGYSIAFIGGIEKVLELLDTVNPKN